MAGGKAFPQPPLEAFGKFTREKFKRDCCRLLGTVGTKWLISIVIIITHENITYIETLLYVLIYEHYYKETWALKNWCFWTVVLEKTLESPLDCKEIKPVNPKGDQSWIFIGRLMLKLKLQYFGHLMRRADSFEKTLMLEKTEGRRTRRGWSKMRWLDGITDGDGHEFE